MLEMLYGPLCGTREEEEGDSRHIILEEIAYPVYIYGTIYFAAISESSFGPGLLLLASFSTVLVCFFLPFPFAFSFPCDPIIHDALTCQQPIVVYLTGTQVYVCMLIGWKDCCQSSEWTTGNNMFP
ncbi:hypothetical protein GGR50DRAFT_646960 [Xylaria sp. CBS 124048]|nr:hypothetical protein GGR50DRAFT_646960 [Xylaria sp. CBS 124048]